ncbi:uncharacterized protein [Watersipora subatra]|uniref:uncharacterized protein n=1 Tax=Watersipora subatra TaxID=2589382 RepID=UPI00355BDEDF
MKEHQIDILRLSETRDKTNERKVIHGNYIYISSGDNNRRHEMGIVVNEDLETTLKSTTEMMKDHQIDILGLSETRDKTNEHIVIQGKYIYISSEVNNRRHEMGIVVNEDLGHTSNKFEYITGAGENLGFETTTRVRQRSMLSPLLFIMYLDLIIKEVADTQPLTNVLAYAADIAQLDKSEEELQNHLMMCEAWYINPNNMKEITAADMKVVGMINGVTKMDRIHNEDLCKAPHLIPIADKIKNSQIRWFG